MSSAPRPGFEAVRQERMREARAVILEASSWYDFLERDPLGPCFTVVLDAAGACGLHPALDWVDVQSAAIEAIDAPALRWRWELRYL